MDKGKLQEQCWSWEERTTAAMAVMWEDQDPPPELGTQDGGDSKKSLGRDRRDRRTIWRRMAPCSWGHPLREARTGRP